MSSLTNCLLEESRAISNAAEKLNNEEVEKALNLLSKCSKSGDKLVITGVGKSGIVARKIAATFSSVGLMAIYLNPLDALHGDLGIVSSKDICLLLSNSGETEELKAILPHLKRRNTARIAIVGNANSTLANESNVVLEANIDKEVCPLNLAPTASTAVAMAIGDAMASVWMERHNISSSDFAFNHPAGQLGKQLTLTANDLMRPAKEINAIHPKSSIEEVITQITEGYAGFAWVEDPSRPNILIGIITDGDLRRALQNNNCEIWKDLHAEDLMTKDPLVAEEGILALEALKLMERNRRKPISVLPVTKSDQIVIGFLRLHDLIQSGLT